MLDSASMMTERNPSASRISVVLCDDSIVRPGGSEGIDTFLELLYEN